MYSINRHKETTHKWWKISGTISHINLLKLLQLRTQMTPKHLKIIRQRSPRQRLTPGLRHLRSSTTSIKFPLCIKQAYIPPIIRNMQGQKIRLCPNVHHQSEINTEVLKQHLYSRKMSPYIQNVYIVLNFQKHQIQHRTIFIT